MKKIDIPKKDIPKNNFVPDRLPPPTVASHQRLSHQPALRTLRPGYWQIHIPPHDQSAYIVEDTLEVPRDSRSEATKKPLKKQKILVEHGEFLGTKGGSPTFKFRSLWIQLCDECKTGMTGNSNYYPSNHPVQTLHYTHVVGPPALFCSNSFFPEDALADAYAMIYHGSYILEESYKLSITKNYWKGPFSINHTKS